MKFILVIEDDRNRWEEDYDKVTIETLAEAEDWGRSTVDYWNRTLRPHELPRRYVGIKECEQQPEEIQPEEDKSYWKECEYCEGTGQAEPDCKECNGNGWVSDPDDGGTMTCPECDNEECDQCDGVGEVFVACD